MEIKTKYQIRRMQIKELQMMTAYLIYDELIYDNQIIITDINHRATILQKHSNDPSLCILRLKEDDWVNIIGKVDDFDIVNVQISEIK